MANGVSNALAGATRLGDCPRGCGAARGQSGQNLSAATCIVLDGRCDVGITYRDEAYQPVEFVELSDSDARAAFDAEACRVLGITGDEFARRWHAGQYRDCDDPRITQVAMLLPDAW